MTREDTKKLLMCISAIYPSFNVKYEEMTVTIDAWNMMLKDYPVEAINGALKIYVRTNNTGFAPSVSQLIGCMYKPNENERLTEGEAWALVKKAIQNSGYESENEFKKLPPLVQKAIGGPAILRQWGMTDSNQVNSVIMSNFERAYEAIVSQQEYAQRVPVQISNSVKELINSTVPMIQDSLAI